jgi:FKBP-type peptidyl-prolyl cis-trans isomerase
MTTTKWMGVLTLGLLIGIWGCSEPRSKGTTTQNTTTQNASPGEASVAPADAPMTATASAPAGDLAFSSTRDATSYALGVYMAQGLQRRKVEVDLPAMIRGFKDGQVTSKPAEAEMAGEVSAMSTSQPATGEASASAPVHKAGYGAGFLASYGLRKQKADLDIDLVIKGMTDVVKKNEVLLADDQVKGLVIAIQNEAIVKTRAERLTQSMENRKEGTEFLEANKSKEGVTTRPSGLQYKILKAGDGPIPKPTDTVEINCRGTIINGTEFVNTYTTGKPLTVDLPDRMTIVGLREALTLMPVGSKWQLFIPSRLGYLYRGFGPVIGPDATLLYEVELLGIKSPQSAPAAP